VVHKDRNKATPYSVGVWCGEKRKQGAIATGRCGNRGEGRRREGKVEAPAKEKDEDQKGSKLQGQTCACEVSLNDEVGFGSVLLETLMTWNQRATHPVVARTRDMWRCKVPRDGSKAEQGHFSRDRSTRLWAVLLRSKNIQSLKGEKANRIRVDISG
jgi:hypothetical protein